MAIIKSTVKGGQKPGKAEWVRIKKGLKEASKYPINFDGCPELVRTKIAKVDMDVGYMLLAADAEREKEAAQWCNNLMMDMSNEMG